MAIAATFTANFSAFYDAVDKAIIKVNDFDAAAAKVGPRLSAMADKWSGKKIIEESLLMARAINDLGGVSALTAKQLQEAGSKAAEAAEKMKAMGAKDIPKTLTDIADAAKKAADEAAKIRSDRVRELGEHSDTSSGSMSKLTGIAKGVAGAVGIGFGINAVVAFGQSILATMSQINNLHDATGVSRDGLQRFAYVGAAVGISMDEIGKAVGGLSNRLASGDGSAVVAVQSLGLNLKDLMSAGPEEAFIQLGEAVNKVVDPMRRNAIAADLFGEKLARQLLPMLGDLRTKLDEVPDSAIISDEDIKRADDFGATIDQLLIKVKSWTVAMLTMGKNRGAGRLVNGETYQDDFTGPLPESTAQAGAKYWTVPQVFGPNTGKDIELVNDALGKTQETTAAVITETDLLNNRLKALKADALQPLTKAQQDQARELLSYGASEQETARLVKTTEAALHRYVDAMHESDGAMKKSAAEIAAYNKQWTAANADVEAASNGLFTALSTLSDGYRKVIAEALRSGASVENIAVAWGLEKEQVQAVADSIKVLTSVRALESAAQVATIDTLSKLGVAGDQEIARLKTQIDLQSKIRDIENAKPDVAALKNVGTPATPVDPKQLEELGDRLGVRTTVGFQNGLQELPGSILKAIQGGGSIGGAIGGSLGSSIGGEIAGSLTKSITKNVGGMAGSLLKGVAGMIPVIGAMAGPMIDLAIGGVNKLIGNDEEKKTVNPLRDKLIEAAGGLGALNKQAHDAGMTLDELLKADTVDEYTAAVENLQGAFKGQSEALADVSAAAERYGFTIEELGPALQRQQLDAQAQQLYKDFTVLTAAGVDQIAITDRMGEATNAYLQTAMRMGVEIPSAMRPMLESMAKAGELTDANGEKITDLDASGVKFALTMSEGFNALIKSVDKLADTIGRTLGTAIDSTSDKINKIPKNVDVSVNYSEHGTVGGHTEALEGFARGTDGFRDFGAGTPVMLHGWEAVVPRESTASKHAAAMALETGGGGGAVIVNVNAQGAFFDTPEAMHRLADKVSQALTQKYALTNKLRAA